MAKKQGVSLLILIITIAVMVLITAAAVIGMGNVEMFGMANAAIEKVNMKETENVAIAAWTKAYKEGKRTLVELQEAVDVALIEKGLYDKYAFVVTEDGIIPGSVKDEEVPEKWSESVANITREKIPVPVGFVESPYPNENRKNTGFVIYALTPEEIENGVTDILKVDSNYEYSLKNRNQFVWVPVDDFENEFVRIDFETIDSKISNVLGSGYWEVVLGDNNLPLDSTINTVDYIPQDKLEEAMAMYESVKEYGGFYIGRYEAGVQTKQEYDSYGFIAERVSISDGTNSKLMVSMGNYPYNGVAWGESLANTSGDDRAVALARSFYPKDGTTYGAVSTLTYGVQWDRTLSWSRTTNSKINLKDSVNCGVYSNSVIDIDEVNKDAQYAEYSSSMFSDWKKLESKSDGQKYLLTTGASKQTNINNVYDMAGNLSEWTMEGYLKSYTIIRGGDFAENSEDYSVATKDISYAYFETEFYGFRPSLYIRVAK